MARLVGRKCDLHYNGQRRDSTICFTPTMKISVYCVETNYDLSLSGLKIEVADVIVIQGGQSVASRLPDTDALRSRGCEGCACLPRPVT